MRVSRGRLLLGPAGRARALWLLAACVIVVVVLGATFAGQSRADRFDSAADSPFIAFLPGHYRLLRALAFPGSLVPALVISVAVAACCLLARRLNGALLALTAAPAAAGLVEGPLKHAFGRTYLGSLSYPSGHVTSIVALTAMLAVLLLIPPQRPGTRPVRVLAVAVGCLACGLVAAAVIALRWHYLTDAVAGAAVGVGTVCALALLLDLAWSRRGQPFASRPRASPSR